MKIKIVCRKDGVESKEITISSYEHEPGIPPQNVPAYECPVCKEFIFTPEQVEKMAALTGGFGSRKGKISQKDIANDDSDESYPAKEKKIVHIGKKINFPLELRCSIRVIREDPANYP